MRNPVSYPSSFALTVNTALVVGTITFLLVFSAGISDNPIIMSIAGFLGGLGNNLFLIATNLLIIVWGCRRRLWSILSLTLWLDLLVWATVQGTKLIAIAPWTLRPNGGPGGFPSGHATHSFAMAFLLTFLFPRFGWLWYACAAAISWSRLETYAHSGIQITAGIMLGMAIGWILVQRWQKNTGAGIRVSETNAPLSAPSPKEAYVFD